MAERLDNGSPNEPLRELDALLDGIAQKLAHSSGPLHFGALAPTTRIYSAVTRYWPRIAVALVVIAAAADLVIGGLTADSTLEFYLLAWATTTGGLWFLFEKAEKALSEASRAAVVGWVRETDLRSGIAALPGRFAALFDHVFGDHHLSWRCVRGSAVASLAMVGAMILIFVATGGVLLRDVESLVMLGIVITFVNLLPDYVSLLETRALIRWAEKQGSVSRSVLLLLADALVTGLIAFSALVVLSATVPASYAGGGFFSILAGWIPHLGQPFLQVVLLESDVVFEGGSTTMAYNGLPMGVFFYSTFFTSVWLWLYAASVLLSRLLLRMNSGLGFLLRVTDVEKQPFRSMGFVSVIITSVIFALGLPLVLL